MTSVDLYFALKENRIRYAVRLKGHDEMSKPLVIYHGGCRDGFCAAWVAWRLLRDKADYHPGYYGQGPPDVKGRMVWVLDFSYPRDVMDRMAADATSLAVYDHHKTAEAALAGAPYANFDMNRSGAGLAWDCLMGGQRDLIVDYIEDRDLWRFALPHSREINAYLSTLPFDFEKWSAVSTTCAQDIIETGDGTLTMRKLGAPVVAKTEQYVAEVAKNARRIRCHGNDVLCVNAPQVDVSELGHALAQNEAFAVAWWQRADGVFQYSLRSVGDFDVSELAKLHGGGGHKNAAGFQSSTLLW